MLELDPFENCGRDPDSAQLFRCLEAVRAVRAAVGPEMEILIDAHGRFSPGTAIRIGRAFEELDVYWFEEPTDSENLDALAEVGRGMRGRLATGERIYTRHHLPPLLATSQVRVMQPDPIHVGGLLEAYKIAALATVRAALEAGISYLDTAPWCGLGKSEHRIGSACRASTCCPCTISTRSTSPTRPSSSAALSGLSRS